MQSRGYNQENIQNLNRTLLLRLLRREGASTRIQLSKQSLLKQATVTNIVSDFISWGLVKETGSTVGDKGRRAIGITINKDDFGVLGIRVARKNYTVAVFDLLDNMVLDKRVQLEDSQVPEDIFNAILKDAEALIWQVPERKILAIGVALPGPFNKKQGRIELMTGISGWSEVPLQEKLEERFEIPVFLEQDANAGALAQYWHDPGASQKSVLVYVAAGQGIGAGIISDGKLMRGDIGTAGEIGHTSICYNGPRCTCGNYGCLENYCSSIAFVKQVNEKLGTDLTIDEIRGKIGGDPQIQEIYKEACDKLSVGIVNIINNFNPAMIVIGDEMSHIMPELMCRRVREEVKKRVLPAIYDNTEISMSVVKKDSMVHGAAIVAIEDIFSSPMRYFQSKS